MVTFQSLGTPRTDSFSIYKLYSIKRMNSVIQWTRQFYLLSKKFNHSRITMKIKFKHSQNSRILEFFWCQSSWHTPFIPKLCNFQVSTPLPSSTWTQFSNSSIKWPNILNIQESWNFFDANRPDTRLSSLNYVTFKSLRRFLLLPELNSLILYKMTKHS